MRARTLLLVWLAACSNACVTYPRGTLTVASTEPVSVEMAVVAENVEGRFCGDVFADRFRLAIDAALEKSPGANALVDVSYHFERFCMVVRATAVRIHEPQGNPPH